jgi:hypothetical protein
VALENLLDGFQLLPRVAGIFTNDKSHSLLLFSLGCSLDVALNLSEICIDVESDLFFLFSSGCLFDFL